MECSKEVPISRRKDSRRPQDPTDPGQLLLLVEAFVRADTWDNSRRLLDAPPELLDGAVEPLFDRLVQEARARGEDKAVPYIAAHCAFLRRAREAGVDRAWAEVVLLQPVPAAGSETTGRSF